MAQRWSINEDIIICQNCIKYPGAYSKRGYVEHLAHLLQEAGYESRSIRSIQHRAYAFEIVREGRNREGRQLPYASEQVAEVYKVLLDEKMNKHEEIAACIRELYNPDEETGVELTNPNPNNAIGYQHTIDFSATFPMVLQKFLDLKKIKKHKKLCESIGMKPDRVMLCVLLFLIFLPFFLKALISFSFFEGKFSYFALKSSFFAAKSSLFEYLEQNNMLNDRPNFSQNDKNFCPRYWA